MKAFRNLLTIAATIIVLPSHSQTTPHFNFIITDLKGNPLYNAKLIVLNGEEHFTGYDGKLVYYGEKDYVKKDGRYVETRSMPLYITAKAANHKDYRIELSKYKYGSTITIKLAPVPVKLEVINVYVRDRSGRPVPNASVMVIPGKGTTTDSKGYAKAMHNQIIGEWVTIRVKAPGYKQTEQHIPTGDATREVNGVTIPPATAYFTLEKGTDEVVIFNINVEVADKATDERLPGAKVMLTLSDGTKFNGTTNAQGEVMFSDLEYGFMGTSARIIATKPGYKETWSDLTTDLTTGQDNSTRQFLVFMEKNSESSLAGVYVANTGYGVSTLTLNGSGNSMSGTSTHVKSNGFTDRAQWTNIKVQGNKITCNWTEAYEDQDKKVARQGTAEFTFSGNSLVGTAFEGEPTTSWKPGVSQYTGFYKGMRWPLNFTKK